MSEKGDAAARSRCNQIYGVKVTYRVGLCSHVFFLTSINVLGSLKAVHSVRFSGSGVVTTTLHKFGRLHTCHFGCAKQLSTRVVLSNHSYCKVLGLRMGPDIGVNDYFHLAGFGEMPHHQGPNGARQHRVHKSIEGTLSAIPGGAPWELAVGRQEEDQY